MINIIVGLLLIYLACVLIYYSENKDKYNTILKGIIKSLINVGIVFIVLILLITGIILIMNQIYKP